MNDAEIRIACINAAAITPGNPNHLAMAREYYNFVLEGQPVVAPEATEETSEDTTKTGRKGARK